MGAHKVNVEYLIELARDRSVKSRNELATVIKDLFQDENTVLSDREKDLMFKVIETLFQEVEVSIRQSLSEQLANLDDLPESLAIYLASDKIQIAYPILTRSCVLKDTDLIKIIRQRTKEHHLAITLRKEISESVSDALVETGEEDVIVSLLYNKNSKISNSTMAYLVEQASRVDTFQDPLVHRDDLDAELAEKLYAWVSEALRQDIAAKFDLPNDLLLKFNSAEEINPAAKKDGLKKADSTATLDLVDQLKSKGMISVEVLVAALNQGEISLFFGLFSEMTKLSSEFIKDVVFDGTGEEIAVACKVIGVTEIQFLNILKKTRKQHAPGQADLNQERVNKLLTFYRTMLPQNAVKAIDTWKLHFGSIETENQNARHE